MFLHSTDEIIFEMLRGDGKCEVRNKNKSFVYKSSSEKNNYEYIE